MTHRYFATREEADKFALGLSRDGWRVVTVMQTDGKDWIVTASMDVPNKLREAVSTVAGGLALVVFAVAIFVTIWTALPGGMVPA